MNYRMCTRCIMDTSDPEITFDSDGVCNHCNDFVVKSKREWFPNEYGNDLLKRQIDLIKSSRSNTDYNCILGLSGGVDSSYLAIKLKEYELNPLVVHVDAGWNSELAVANIEKIVNYCSYDLHTCVIDWEEMRDLQIAYLKAGIANQDVPQDHVFFATLYHYATKNNIKFIISGGNLATEGVFPNAWHGSSMDAINLHSIHKRFGERPLKNYKTISFFDYYLWYPIIKGMRTVRPLNYMPYIKSEALVELENKIGYKPYPRKHGESLFTKLFQNYYLPTKFQYDKRRPHFSSLIVSGQMTREEALEKLKEPLYDPQELEIDISYFCKKLRITRDQFDEFLAAKPHHYKDFPTWEGRYRFLKGGQGLVERILGKRVRVYS